MLKIFIYLNTIKNPFKTRYKTKQHSTILPTKNVTQTYESQTIILKYKLNNKLYTTKLINNNYVKTIKSKNLPNTNLFFISDLVKFFGVRKFWFTKILPNTTYTPDFKNFLKSKLFHWWWQKYTLIRGWVVFNINNSLFFYQSYFKINSLLETVSLTKKVFFQLTYLYNNIFNNLLYYKKLRNIKKNRYKLLIKLNKKSKVF